MLILLKNLICDVYRLSSIMNKAQNYREDIFTLRDESQLELFDDAELYRVVSESALYCKKSQSKHCFTGDKIWKHNKRIYHAIVRLLGEGQSIRYIDASIHRSESSSLMDRHCMCDHGQSYRTKRDCAPLL